MKLAHLRTKRVVIPAIAVVAVLGAGGTAWAASANDGVAGDERDRVADAATQAVPGSVTDVETSDDPGEAYEVDVRRDDGSEIEVVLDEGLEVIGRDADGRNDTDDGNGEDRRLGAEERASVEEAALAAVGGGRVTDVEASDDPGEAYEAEVRDPDGTEWDIALDAGHQVLDKEVDD